MLSQSASLSPAPPKMRSRFQVAKPAAWTAAEIVAAACGTWRRPRPASTWAWVDCSPNGDPRHPAAPVRTEMGRVGVLGIAFNSHLSAVGAGHGVEDPAQRLGVEAGRGPPPKKTEEAGARPPASAARCSSRMHVSV